MTSTNLIEVSRMLIRKYRIGDESYYCTLPLQTTEPILKKRKVEKMEAADDADHPAVTNRKVAAENLRQHYEAKASLQKNVAV